MWEISTFLQISSFFKALCFGCILCVVADIVRTIERVLKMPLLIVLFVDSLVSFSAALCTFCFLLATTLGEIRFYVLFGIGCGFLLFRKTLSRYICTGVSFGVHFFIICTVWLQNFFKKMLKSVFNFVGKVVNKVNFIKKRFLFKKRLEN